MQDAMAHGGADGRGETGEWAGRGGAGRGGRCLFSCVTFCASEIMGDHCPIRQSLGPKKGTPTRPGSSSPSSCFSKALSSISLHSPFLSNPPPHPPVNRSAPFLQALFTFTQILLLSTTSSSLLFCRLLVAVFTIPAQLATIRISGTLPLLACNH